MEPNNLTHFECSILICLGYDPFSLSLAEAQQKIAKHCGDHRDISTSEFHIFYAKGLGRLRMRDDEIDRALALIRKGRPPERNALSSFLKVEPQMLFTDWMLDYAGRYLPDAYWSDVDE